MDSYYSTTFASDFKIDDDSKDAKDINRSSKHIDSGVCVESLSSVSSILTSSSSLSSNYSRKSSTKQNKNSLTNLNDSINSSTKYGKDRCLFESAELTDLYEYDYNEKEDEQEDVFDYNYKQSPSFDLINEKQLIDKNYLLSDANLQNENGDTMLHLAIREHKTQLAYHIISIFPHPDYLDIRNKWSQTALHLAILTDQHKLVRRLIASGSTIDLIEINGNTSLHLACRTGDLNLVKQFFQPIAKQETLNLSYNVTTNDTFNYKKFILNEKNFEGENCIFLAAQSGNFELIKYLVDEGAEINCQELKEGNSLLHFAVQIKSVDLIEFLIKTCGADVNQMNYGNKTPLALAWSMYNDNPSSKVIRIMIHLLKECGGEPIDYYSSDDDQSSNDDDLSN